MRERYILPLLLLVLAAALGGCTFNFEMTSQRTALENQVMGSYKELEDDLVLMSSVRSSSATVAAGEPSARQRKAIDARQNQEFNRDDVDELKTLEVLGETNDGRLTLLPSQHGKASSAAKERRELAERLVEEENADRMTIWRRIIETNANLSEKDLPEVRRTYAKMQREQTLPGQWYQDDSGAWQRKSGDLAKDVQP